MFILDHPREVAASDEPLVYKAFREKTGHDIIALEDGKAFETETIRTDGVISRFNYCNKIGKHGLQSNVYSSTPGLIIEATPICLGSGTETAHVKFYGQIRELTPAYGETRYSDRELPELIDNLPFGRVIHKDLDSLSCSSSSSSEDDSDTEAEKSDSSDDRIPGKVVARRVAEQLRKAVSQKLIDPKQQPGGGGRKAYDAKDNSDDDGESRPNDDAVIETRGTVTAAGKLCLLWKNAVGATLDALQSSSTSSRGATVNRILRLDALDTEMEFIQVKGPNMNAAYKKRQLYQNERFREAVRDRLLPCTSLLAHRLLKLEPTDKKLLNGLEVGGSHDQFRLPTRLSKFPLGTALLTDRGYRKHSIYYEYFNRHVCPSFLDGRAQFEYEDMETDIDIKRLRYTPEVCFARVVCCRFFRSKIAVEDFPVVDDAICWAYAMANLYKPLRKPGDWDDYIMAFGTEKDIYEHNWEHWERYLAEEADEEQQQSDEEGGEVAEHEQQQAEEEEED